MSYDVAVRLVEHCLEVGGWLGWLPWEVRDRIRIDVVRPNPRSLRL